MEYFEQQQLLAEASVIPLLKQSGKNLNGLRVLEVGCSHGGILFQIKKHWPEVYAKGIDVDSDAIENAKGKIRDIVFEAISFFDLNDEPFDVIVLRDVLEHIIHVRQALEKTILLLRPGGVIYVSYAPFYSPFGGHQHNGSGLFSFLPWLQILPKAWFMKLVRVQGNAYKNVEFLGDDMESVFLSKLTVAKQSRILRELNLKKIYSCKYFVRPDHHIKFGWKVLRLPNIYIPIFTEMFCTGEELLLRAA